VEAAATGADGRLNMVTRSRIKALAAGTLIVGVLLAGALPSAADTPTTLQVATGDGNPPELVKTVPISRQPGGKKRVVLSVDPPELGTIQPGDRVSATGELEVSVTCTEPSPQCVGKLYDFSPHVRGRVYLGHGQHSTGGLPIGGWKKITCSQQLPNRNHHCVLVIDGPSRRIDSLSETPCEPGRCHLNLVLSAYHDNARVGDLLVIGGDQDSGIEQDKGRLNAAVYRPGDMSAFPAARNPIVSKMRRSAHVPVAGHDGAMSPRVLYSVRLNHLQAGEQLVVDARAHVGIGNLPYNTLIRSQLLLTEGPGAVDHKGLPGLVERNNGEADESNGFNCTRGASDFRTPCLIHKVGIVKMVHDARTHPFQDKGRAVPLYLNLVTSAAQEYGGTHHLGDQANVTRAGFIRVYRYSRDYRR
jgi:hypothetical protein